MRDNNPRTAAAIGALSFAVTLAGAVIGPSFSTGREIMTYFGGFGTAGYIGMLITFGLLAVFAYMIFCTARNMDRYTVEWQASPRGWKPLRIFFLWFTVVGYILSLAAMVAAAGSVLQTLFRIHPLWGALLMTLLSGVTAFIDLERYAGMLRFTVPVMVVMAVSFCICFSLFPIAAETDTVAEIGSPMAKGWLLSCLVYGGYNTGAIRAVVPLMAKNIPDRKTAGKAAVLFALILLLVAGSVMMAITCNLAVCSTESMPTVALAYRRSAAAGILYGLAVLMAIYHACSLSVQVLKGTLTELQLPSIGTKKSNRRVCILLAAAYLLSFIGYTTFVDKVWAVFGYISYFTIAFMVYNFFYYKKHPQNKTTAVHAERSEAH